MIPLKLQLKNFLSYGSQPQIIDFEPYHLICLSGKNGHGKSALLDAITWALWGQARKISGTVKADSHLLKLGQTQMMVTFDFSFNNQQYRIKREYAQTYGKPYATLEFGIVNAENGSFIALTDKTIRDTQAKIESMIGLDYESFINSAFLRQGQANEFSKKSPKERKDILGTILGLGSYELLRKLAMDKSKKAILSADHLIKLQQRIEAELQQTGNISSKILELNTNLATLKEQENAQSQELTTLELRKKDLAAQLQQYQMLVFQQQHVATTKTNEQKNLLTLYQQWRLSNKQYRSLPNLTELEAEKQYLIKRINHHQKTLHTTLELKERYLKEKELEQKILADLTQQQHQQLHEKNIALERLKNDYANKRTKVHELEKKIQEHTQELGALQQEQTSLECSLQTLNPAASSMLITLEKQFEKRKSAYHTWVAQANLTNNELAQLVKKQQLTHDENNPSCPLCEQNLSAARKKFLKTQFNNQEKALNHSLARFSKLLPELKKILVCQHEEITELKKIITEQQLLEMRKQETHKAAHKITTLLHALTYQHITTQQETTALLETLTQQEKAIEHYTTHEQHASISNNAQYQAITLSLTALKTSIQELSYNQEQHQHDTARLNTLEQKQAHALSIMQDYALQQQRKDEIHQRCMLLKTIKKQQQELTNKLSYFDTLEQQTTALAQQEAIIIEQLSSLRTAQEKTLQEKGSFEHQRNKLIELEEEHKQHKANINQLEGTMHDYQTIATALSKDGIQALLIEDAIPEIEQEANNLLGQLTDNQAHIFIESLRDLKKGGTKETLDIKISDPSGIRPYEMFSGGEAFRIDFALRIAISKLLARRAGTSLQTLIIDEGFGSQDEEGLGHIMDALYKIQDNFCKIIIVSHLPAMKDQFPVHFYVEKGVQGSTIKVIEQG